MNFALIFILLIICLFFGVNNKVQKFAYFIFAAIFSLIFAFRPSSSPDTAEYIHIFQSINAYDNWFDTIERFEVGYCVLNRIVKFLTDSYECLFFVVSLFNYFVYYIVLNKVIKEQRNNDKKTVFVAFVPILAFYTSYYGLLYNAIALRAGLAISLLYLSFFLLYEKRFLGGIVTFILAPFFHQTAVLALPLVPLFYYRKTIRKNTSFVILFFSFFLYIINIRTFTTSLIPRIADILYSRFPDVPLFWWLSHYTENNKAEEGGISAYMLLNFILTYILICNSKKRLDTFGFVYLIGIIIYSLFGNYSLMVRYAEYFLFSVCLSYGVLFSSYGDIILSSNAYNLRVNRIIFCFIISMLFFIIFLRNSVHII